jgi:hypothetical protein
MGLALSRAITQNAELEAFAKAQKFICPLGRRGRRLGVSSKDDNPVRDSVSCFLGRRGWFRNDQLTFNDVIGDLVRRETLMLFQKRKGQQLTPKTRAGEM